MDVTRLRRERIEAGQGNRQKNDHGQAAAGVAHPAFPGPRYSAPAPALARPNS
jgi:hypothetical protein